MDGDGGFVDSAKQAATGVNDAVKHDLTVLWAALPAWQRDNAFIHSGYRPQSSSYRGSLASLAHLHNETVNILTHLFGALLFLLLGLLALVDAPSSFPRYYTPRYAQASPQDVRVLACFFGGAVACLGISAGYHTFSNHSPAVARLGNQLDYLGIVLLIWGSFIPSIHYGFADRPALVATYWAMISTIGAGCALVCTSAHFRTPAWRPLRAAMFAAMGLSAVVPVLHGVLLYGAPAMRNTMGLAWLLLQGALYLLGAGLYAARLPEKLAPGRFDIVGSSHQIFHVLVVLAALAHLRGLVVAFDARQARVLAAAAAAAAAAGVK